MIETEEELSGRRLTRGEVLPFRCHPGLPCFNSCCKEKRLTLLPYDVLRLSRALGSTTSELLSNHGELEIERASGWPMLRIRLEPDGRCPFLRPEGCGVYADRPTCCRIYPLARAVRVGPDDALDETFLVDATEERCGGFDARETHTVEEWVGAQGLDAYRAPNERAAKLFLHPSRPRPLSLSSAEVHAVVMALYNMDVFREFVSRAGFAANSGFSADRVAEALRSDEALLALGQDWLAAKLFA